VSGHKSGLLAEASVRLPFDSPVDPRLWLKKAVRELGAIYGPRSFFDCTISANLLLKSNKTSRFNVWYGHGFGNDNADITVGPAYLLRNPGEVDSLVPKEVLLEDLVSAFQKRLPDSDVSVDGVINLIYILRAWQSGEEPPARAERRLQRSWENKKDAALTPSAVHPIRRK
jgi:hypothetical protein